MKPETYQYFNPVSFFDQKPEVEEFFYTVSLKTTKKGSLHTHVVGAKEVPGKGLIDEFFIDTKYDSFGAFSTARLISEQTKSTAARQDRGTQNERECLEYVITCIKAELAVLEKDHRPEDDPHRQMYGCDPDLRGGWISDCQSWDAVSEDIKTLKLLCERPYTLHLVLEDDTNVYVNESEAFKLTDFDFSFKSLVKRLGPKNRLTGRIFGGKENNLPYIRQNSKTTFEGQRIAIKRSVDIHKGMLVKATDIYIDSFDDQGPKTTDPLLQDVYYKRRGDAGIANIIETIQHNQMNILSRPFNEHIFVQGVAGSGKTMVLLQRLSDMVFMNKNMRPEDVVFVEPNIGFDEYFKAYFKERHLTSVRRNTMAGYLMSLVVRYYEKYAMTAYKKGEEKGQKTAKQAGTSFISKNGYERKWNESVCLDKDGPEDLRKLIYGRGFISFCQGIIDSHEEKQISVTQSVYSVKKGDLSYTMSYPDVDDFPKLIGEFLRAVRKETNVTTIPSTFEGLASNPGTIPTCLAYGLVRMLFIKYGPLNEKQQDRLIAVDECQDYYFRVFEIINLAEPNTVFNLFGDLAQDLGYHGPEWDKTQGIAEQIERHVTFKFNKFRLLENYRNSDEILNFCKKEFNVKDIGYGVSTMPPQKIDIHRLISVLSFHHFLKDRSAVIFAKRYEGAIKTYLKPLFERYGLHEVGLFSPIEAKGMEFDNVFVVGYSMMTYNERYVACSRALNELYIVQTKEMTEDVAV